MATADGLFTLLTQLQTMESSLVEFMLETILKLNTLTEAKVFFLVETSTRRRRYCGNRELTDLYEKGCLRLQSTDSAVEFNAIAAAKVLVDTPSRKRSATSTYTGSNGYTYGPGPEILSSSTSSSSSSTSPFKTENLSSIVEFAQPIRKKKRKEETPKKDDSLRKEDSTAINGTSNATLDESSSSAQPTMCKVELSEGAEINVGSLEDVGHNHVDDPSAAAAAAPHPPQIIGDVVRNISDAVFNVNDNDAVDREPEASFNIGDAVGPVNGAGAALDEDLDGSAMFAIDHTAPVDMDDDFTNSFPPPQPMPDLSLAEDGSSSLSGFFDHLPQPELEEKKLDAILKIENPYAAYDKRTVEYKLWMSVMYNVGKNMAFACPYTDRSRKNDQVQAYFLRHCELFTRHCTALLFDKDHRPPEVIPPPKEDPLRTLTVPGFIRHSIRHGYKQGIKTALRLGILQEPEPEPAPAEQYALTQ